VLAEDIAPTFFAALGAVTREPSRSFNDWSNSVVLYLAVGSTPGRVKIGRTADPQRRERGLRTADPGLRLAAVFTVLDPNDNRLSSVQAEKAIHKQFAARRVAGEWYAGTVDELLELIDKVTLRTPCPPFRTPVKITVDLHSYGAYE
jgi:hypothetical protein